MTGRPSSRLEFCHPHSPYAKDVWDGVSRLAKIFTDIADESEDHKGTTNIFWYKRDETRNPRLHVNYYYIDEEIIRILSKVYTQQTKLELENDKVIMAQFFGSFESGQWILQALIDET